MNDKVSYHQDQQGHQSHQHYQQVLLVLDLWINSYLMVMCYFLSFVLVYSHLLLYSWQVIQLLFLLISLDSSCIWLVSPFFQLYRIYHPKFEVVHTIISYTHFRFQVILGIDLNPYLLDFFWDQSSSPAKINIH